MGTNKNLHIFQIENYQHMDWDKFEHMFQQYYQQKEYLNIFECNYPLQNPHNNLLDRLKRILEYYYRQNYINLKDKTEHIYLLNYQRNNLKCNQISNILKMNQQMYFEDIQKHKFVCYYLHNINQDNNQHIFYLQNL